VTLHQPLSPQIDHRDVSVPLSQRRDVAVVVPAAGQGLRLGGGVPKALRELAGEPLLVHACRRLRAAPSVGLIVVVAPAAEVSAVQAMLPGTIVVVGGATRQLSVAAGLAAVPAEFDIVLVHDAARALVPPELVEVVAAAVRAGHDAVIPALPVVDTIKRVDAAQQVRETVDRAVLRAVQTPQGFRRAVLARAHDAAPDEHTDDAGMVERLGLPVHCVPGAELAMKITRPVDLVVAEAMLNLAAVADQGRSDR
jgi:2-C-methyl-D-erythritol 4-phosphate cytidylyltransferase